MSKVCLNSSHFSVFYNFTTDIRLSKIQMKKIRDKKSKLKSVAQPFCLINVDLSFCKVHKSDKSVPSYSLAYIMCVGKIITVLNEIT